MQSVPNSWINWLKIICGVFILYGLGLVFLPEQIQDVQGAIYYNWPLTEDGFSQVTAIDRNYFMLLYGIIGGVLIGWAVLIYAMVNGPLRYGQRWAWQALIASLSAWFVTDTLISAATGYSINVLFNVVSAVAFAVPLSAIRRYMTTDNTATQ